MADEQKKTNLDYVNEIWNIADYVRDVISRADYNKVVLQTGEESPITTASIPARLFTM